MGRRPVDIASQHPAIHIARKEADLNDIGRLRYELYIERDGMEPVRASGLVFAMADASQIIARRKKQGIVKLDGRMTSVSLEPEFWAALKDMARERGTSAADIVRQIDRTALMAI